MVSVMHDRVKGPDAAIRCRQWWIGHCLYLDAKSRIEFDRCAHEVFLYRDLMDPTNPEETKARFYRIVTPTVEPRPTSKEMADSFLIRCYQNLPFALRSAEAARQIKERQDKIVSRLLPDAAAEPIAVRRKIS